MPVSFIMLDIDFFKRVNDTRGHSAGDRVLQAVAKRLLDNSRGGDVACRYGGEEFLLVLPNTAADIALQRAEDIRALVGSSPVPCDGEAIAVTLSAGVATYPDDGASADAVIRRADDALFAAKAAGRNCVRRALETTVAGTPQDCHPAPTG